MMLKIKYFSCLCQHIYKLENQAQHQTDQTAAFTRERENHDRRSEIQAMHLQIHVTTKLTCLAVDFYIRDKFLGDTN